MNLIHRHLLKDSMRNSMTTESPRSADVSRSITASMALAQSQAQFKYQRLMSNIIVIK